VNIQVQFMQDEYGFISQECPACRRRFKATFSGGGSAPLGFCPYCGHDGRDCWWTVEQADYLSSAAVDQAIGPEFERMARDIDQKSSMLKMTVTPRGPTPQPPNEADEPWPIFTAPCCSEPIRYDGEYASLKCVICGRDTPTSGNTRTGKVQ